MMDGRPKVPVLLRVRGWFKPLIGEVGGSPEVYRDGAADAQDAKENDVR